MNTKQKKYLNIATLLILAIFAVFYFTNHTNLFSEFSKIPIYIFIVILLLNLLQLIAISRVFISVLHLNKIKLTFKTSLILNSNSLVLNFFMPGQAGPVYRGYYLKEKHNLKVLDYTISTIVYYAVYGVVAVCLLMFGIFPVFPAVLATGIILISGYLLTLRYLYNVTGKRLFVSGKILINLISNTVFQLFLAVIIYFIEIHFIKHNVKIREVLSYTAVAALSLFVSLTPAGIGIREAFLIFSEKLTNLNTNQVVLASLVDRSIYIIYLCFIGLYYIYQKINNKMIISPDIAKK